ncbi:hypothetical protein GCM10027298_11490 [Epidermidibacterium keratini]
MHGGIDNGAGLFYDRTKHAIVGMSGTISKPKPENDESASETGQRNAHQPAPGAGTGVPGRL